METIKTHFVFLGRVMFIMDTPNADSQYNAIYHMIQWMVSRLWIVPPEATLQKGSHSL